jgi:hypothetical protein
MCDGFGTGFSSGLILNENNSKTEAEIDTIMKSFMGINRYIKMNTLPYDVIHHIDMHIKLLDEETLLVGQYPTGVADGPQIEANLQYILTNFNSVFGTPYKVVRIPMPPDATGAYPNATNNADYRTYTNSVFVNKTIILPFYAQQYDTTAVRIYKEALPGYTIVGIDCNSIISSLGAIHCITKEVSSSDPLLISHQPLHDTYTTTNPYTVDARIQHTSGILNALIYYRTDTTLAWQSSPLTNSGGYNWTGNIPAQPGGSVVYYYIEAESTSHKIQRRPITAPVNASITQAGFWKFNVLINTEITVGKDAPNNLGMAFPNPSHGLTCVPVNTHNNATIKITLKNILGEEVLLFYAGKNSGEKKYFMNTSLLGPGFYILEMATDNELFSQKLIVK